MAIPVQIISGFLGAGKTTAIRAQLEARRDQKVAVIVNDFGEAALDEAALSEDEPFRITNIPGGCVCCTAPEGFVDALGAVLEEKPDRLVIEPTGLARPQDLIDTIRRCPHRDAFELAPTVVLVDPHVLATELDPDTRQLFDEQAQAADLLVANRTDLASNAEVEAFERYAADLWPPPLRIYRTQHGRLPPEVLGWPPGEGGRAPRQIEELAHLHSDSTSGHRARSWRWSREVVFSGRRLREALGKLAAGAEPVARFKGIFRTEEGTSRLEIAGGVLHDRLCAHRRDSRADAIVSGGEETLDRIGEQLEAALLRDEELQLDSNRIEWVLPDGRVYGLDREAMLALPGGIADVSPLFPKRRGAAATIEAIFESLGLPAAGSAVVVAGDGFAAEPVGLSVLRSGVLLHSLDGMPLPADQGGPFRLLIPDDASAEPVSCANVKGVAKVVVRGS